MRRNARAPDFNVGVLDCDVVVLLAQQLGLLQQLLVGLLELLLLGQQQLLGRAQRRGLLLDLGVRELELPIEATPVIRHGSHFH